MGTRICVQIISTDTENTYKNLKHNWIGYSIKSGEKMALIWDYQGSRRRPPKKPNRMVIEKISKEGKKMERSWQKIGFDKKKTHCGCPMLLITS